MFHLNVSLKKKLIKLVIFGKTLNLNSKNIVLVLYQTGKPSINKFYIHCRKTLKKIFYSIEN